MQTIISLEDLNLSYPILQPSEKSFRSQLFKFGKSKKKQLQIQVFDKLAVSIAAGERVGLIGNNGAGKSTFLRLIAGVYAPTSGYINISGNVTALLELGTGLDLEANGYENIRLLMAARSIPLSRLATITLDVEQFTELGEALERPVRTYSSGMRLRLTFAVATANVLDVLLLDEIIGVGDRTFRQKSIKRIEAMISEAGTLIIASHSSALLKSYCKRGLVFQAGKIAFDGNINDAIKFSKLAIK